MYNKNLIFNFLFVVLFIFALLVSNGYIHDRLVAHIDAWRGIVKQAENYKITFKEGITNTEMISVLESKLPLFDKKSFLLAANGKQGYLFPDTYFFTKGYPAEKIIGKMEQNFQSKTSSLFAGIDSNKKKDIIILASILEAEAHGEQMQIVADILAKRLRIGMPLQADAVPSTYKEKGLPLVPINNPGIVAIKAAMNTSETDYLYYLHDKNGDIHLAKTYEEHRANIRKYLK